MSARLQPNPERLARDLEALAEFRDPAQPGWTRRSFTPLYASARAWLAERMQGAGLVVSLDAAANLIGRREGSAARPPLMTGSHTDTVVGGGRFDGILGVLGALEAARCLDEAGCTLHHPLEIVDFLAEEPSEFGLSTIGSRGMVGNLPPDLLARTDPAGRTLGAALAELGGQPETASQGLRGPGAVAAFVELHIEQGPLLEREGLPIGLVTGIVGIHRFHVRFTGQPDHAGTTPMDARRDALPAAAELILGLEAMCKGGAGVGTVGRGYIQPNATNVVPATVELWLELRSVEAAFLTDRGARVEALAREIAARRGLGVEIAVVSAEAPVVADARVMATIERVLQARALPVRRMPSGAGHDANQLAHIAPVGMIFVPSRGGRSHCPEEWTDLDQLARGVQVLGETLIELDAALAAAE